MDVKRYAVKIDNIREVFDIEYIFWHPVINNPSFYYCTHIDEGLDSVEDFEIPEKFWCRKILNYVGGTWRSVIIDWSADDVIPHFLEKIR